MLRRRLVLVLVLATSLGLLTAYFVYQAVNRPGAAQPQTENVVVAAANISLGEALTPNHIKLAPWPKDTVPPGSLRSLKDAEGRLARNSMVAGEPVLDSKLAPAGQGGLMPVLIPVGKRAVSIIVEQATQKSGFVVPNSRVDVLVTMAEKDGTQKSRIVLQDVTVLAADMTVEMKDNKPVTMTTVTMALSPEEAERLALSQNQGRVTLALRNLQDTARVSTPGVTAAQLMGAPAPAPSPAKKSSTGTPSVAKRSSGPTRAAATPVKPAPTVQPASTTQVPPPPTHKVSVVRGTAETEQIYVQDPDRGWIEASKAGATKKAQ